MAHHGMSKAEIRRYIEKKLLINLSFTLDNIRPTYVFDSRASYSVPPAIVAFLESKSYEDSIRKAISIGGDSDTIACITGGISEAYYKEIPSDILKKGKGLIDRTLRDIADEFYDKYIR